MKPTQVQVQETTTINQKVGLIVGMISAFLVGMAIIASFNITPTPKQTIKKIACISFVGDPFDTFDEKATSNTIEVVDKTNTYLNEQGIMSIVPDSREMTLNSRKQNFLALMQIDSAKALDSVLNSKSRLDISAISTNCVETLTTREGTIEILTGDNFKDNKSYNQFYLRTNEGKRIALHFANKPYAKFGARSTVSVTGYELDGHMLVNAMKNSREFSVGSSENSGYYMKSETTIDPVLGDQKTLVLLVNFQDTPQPPFTIPEYQTAMQINNAYYDEVSYQKVHFSGVLDTDQNADVRGWYTIPMNSQCIVTDYGDFVEKALNSANADIDFSQYSRLVFYSPLDCPGVSAFSELGKRPVNTPDGVVEISLTFMDEDPTVGPIQHELGHGLGLGHANLLQCGSQSISETGCGSLTYFDFTSRMGLGVDHFNPIHKEELGWFDPSNIQEITTTGQYTLEPLATNTTGVKTLKIPRVPGEDFLYIAYRQPIGYDVKLLTAGSGQILPGDVFDGVVLYLNDYFTYGTSINNTLLVNASPGLGGRYIAVTVGETFLDPASGRTIKLLSKDADGATVQVTMEGKTDFTGPEVSIISPQPNSLVSGTVTLTADASDPSGVEKVQFYERVDNQENLIATDTEAPYETTIDTLTRPNAPMTFFARAYDLSGLSFNSWNNNADSIDVSFTVNNHTDTTVPTLSWQSPGSGSVVNNPVTLSVFVSDPIGIWKVEFSRGPGYSYAPFATAYPVSSSYGQLILRATENLYEQGAVTIYAKAYDFQGNTSVVSNSFYVGGMTPTVLLTKPSSGSIVRGSVTLEAEVIHPGIVVSMVHFLWGSMYLSGDLTEPYSGIFNTTQFSDGPKQMYARAYYSPPNMKMIDSQPITLIVDNTPPFVELTAPSANSHVSGIITITANLTDISGIQRVEFYRERVSTPFAVDKTAPYEVTLDTATVPNGVTGLYVKAYDKAGQAINVEGNIGESSHINVTVEGSTCADVDSSGSIDVSDVTYFVSYIFANGVAPEPLSRADVNSDESIDVSDIILLLGFIFGNGQAPTCTINAPGAHLSPNPTQGMTLEEFKAKYPQVFKQQPSI